MEIWQSILVALIGAAAAIFGSIATLYSQRHRLRAELEFQRRKFEEEIETQRERLHAEFATESSAEAAIRRLLEIDKLRYRSFEIIRHHIGGFESNALRQLLVRAGAVRFVAADGTELWALRDRVVDDFRFSRWKHPDSPLNKPDSSALFPAAFKDPSQY